MKKICFVMPRMGMGGAEKSLLSLLHILAEKDDLQVDLLLFKREGELLGQVPPSVRVIEPEESLRVIFSPFSLKNCRSFRTTCITFLRPVATAITRLLSRKFNRRMQLRWKYAYRHLIAPWQEKYDYACGYLDGECVYYVVDKMQADKKYGWCHSDYDSMGFKAAADEPYYEKLDRIVPLPDKCCEKLQRHFPKQAHKMLPISPVVVPAFVRNAANAPCEEGFAGFNGFRFLSLGRLVEVKGFDMAIDAAAILKEAGLSFRWYILGDGPLRKDLEQQIERLGLSDNVILPGIITNPYPYMKAATLFVQPSRFEGKSVALTECKMLQLPTVATAYATVADQLTDGVDGLIAQMNPQDLAKKILELAQDETRLAQMREQLKSAQFDDMLVRQQYGQLFDMEL